MSRLLVLGLVLGFVAAASASFFDDFESYTSTADMIAVGHWGDFSAAPAVGTALMTTGGNPNQYASHPGGAVMMHHMAPLIPTDAQPVVWEFDLYDATNGANKRMSGGIRDATNGANLLIEHGRYNAFTNPAGDGYGVRVLGVYGAPSWIQYPGLAPTVGWHHLKAVFTATSATFTIDLLSDSSIDGTLTFTGAGYNTALAMESCRIGGPSGLASAGGGCGFDNWSITPEPASLALLLVAGLVLRRR